MLYAFGSLFVRFGQAAEVIKEYGNDLRTSDFMPFAWEFANAWNGGPRHRANALEKLWIRRMSFLRASQSNGEIDTAIDIKLWKPRYRTSHPGPHIGCDTTWEPLAREVLARARDVRDGWPLQKAHGHRRDELNEYYWGQHMLEKARLKDAKATVEEICFSILADMCSEECQARLGPEGLERTKKVVEYVILWLASFDNPRQRSEVVAKGEQLKRFYDDIVGKMNAELLNEVYCKKIITDILKHAGLLESDEVPDNEETGQLDVSTEEAWFSKHHSLISRNVQVLGPKDFELLDFAMDRLRPKLWASRSRQMETSTMFVESKKPWTPLSPWDADYLLALNPRIHLDHEMETSAKDVEANNAWTKARVMSIQAMADDEALRLQNLRCNALLQIGQLFQNCWGFCF